ncbi:MAG: hypothetical protein O7E52_08735 [Candidatus Poribacteria bacterium]|nr:hypothetical protein [Candidatus Poribacteria bacterium]
MTIGLKPTHLPGPAMRGLPSLNQRILWRYPIIWLFLLCIFSDAATGAHSLLNIPLDDPMVQEVYAFIDRVSLKYQLKELLKNRRPYSQGDVAKILDQLRQGDFPLTEIERERLNRLTRFLSNESPLLQAKGNEYRFDLNLELGELTTHRTKPAEPSGTEFAQQIRPIVSGSVRDDFVFLTDLRFYLITNTILEDTVRVEVENKQGGKAGFTTAGLVPAYAKFKLPWFDLLIGRDNVSWGPGRRGNLLLSANALPMDMIQIQAQYGKIGFNALTAIAESPVGNKVLSAHRLDFNLWDKGNLGIAESVVIGEGAFELRLLNPFSVYTVTEPSGGGFLGERETSVGNVLISGDLELRILRNLALYGELMIDDFQPRYGLNSYRNWGSKFGLQLGIHLIDLLSIDNADFRIEYTFINQFSYTHIRPINAYTHFDRLIGHEIGSDADDLWINFKYWLTDTLSAALTYELERHGEGDVTKPHPADAPSDDQWEFLSGTTESTHAFSVEGQYHAVGTFLVEGRYTFSHIRNLNHQEGIRDNQHEIVFIALYRL